MKEQPDKSCGVAQGWQVTHLALPYYLPYSRKYWWGIKFGELVVCEQTAKLTLSRARVFIARKSPGHAFWGSFNRNTARKRYPYCQGYNEFWSVVHPVEYVQIRHGHHSVISSCRTTVVHERGSLAIIVSFLLDQRSRGRDKQLGIAVTDILGLLGEC